MKRASLSGRDVSDIRRCCRLVPSRAEKHEFPLLALYSIQLLTFMKHVMKSMPANDYGLRKGEEAEKQKKEINTAGISCVYIACRVQ